jgi:type II secretory pathway component PulC
MRGSRLVLLGLLTGCGAAAPPAVAPRTVARTVPVAARAESPRPPKGALFREDVNALIERGFPEFLQRVEVEPRLVDGQFRGWSIVNLSPSQFWSGVDLKPGDVVLRVNDLPIERETEAFDVFESLKQSDALRVAFQRGGQTRLLEYKIVAKSN